MTNHNFIIELTFFCSIMTYAYFFVKRYTIKLIPALFNQKTSWNPDIDRFKLLLSSVFFISPIIIFNSLNKLSIANTNFKQALLLLTILLVIFCIWFDLKKINLLKPVKKVNYNRGNVISDNNIYPVNSISKENELINFNKNLNHFISIIKSTNLYSQKVKNFKIDNFTDFIKEKDSDLTELRAIQFVVILYITEYLEENIKSQNLSEIMLLFNAHFQIKNKGKVQKLSSSNWTNFKNDFILTYKKSQFYSELLKEFKEIMNN